MMKRWWQRVRRPTLVRRVLIAQMLLLTLLWSLFIGYVVYESGRSAGLLNASRIYQTLLSVAENAAEEPSGQRKILHIIDLTLRDEYGDKEVLDDSSSLIVSGHGKLLYQSESTPPGINTDILDTIQTATINGTRWRYRTIKSTTSDARATIVIPADSWNVFVTFNSRGYYLIPLIISLPFLLLPAWLSIRVALRPWRRVVQEVATRGPHNLAPLSFRPQHEELSAMVDSINTLLHSVDESAARERAFIADAAHELRTPLAAMRVNVEALQSQTADNNQRALLSGIVSSSNRATRLVAQLLLLMRSDTSAQPGAEKVVLDQLLQDRLAILSPLANTRQVELELHADADVIIHGRPENLVSLIDNLVENAIKYSPAQGSVTVQLRRLPAQRGQPAKAGSAELRIIDQGPGVPVALRERVFDRFFRITDQTQNGSGLGLAIARSVVLQHGGQITLEDGIDGRGLQVVVTLPLADHRQKLR